jgi:hypothetical protein
MIYRAGTTDQSLIVIFSDRMWSATIGRSVERYSLFELTDCYIVYFLITFVNDASQVHVHILAINSSQRMRRAGIEPVTPQSIDYAVTDWARQPGPSNSEAQIIVLPHVGCVCMCAFVRAFIRSNITSPPISDRMAQALLLLISSALGHLLINGRKPRSGAIWLMTLENNINCSPLF